MSPAASQLSQELHDQFVGIGTSISHQLAFSADAAAFYFEQAKLEREHATALRALIKKTQERRAKRVTSVVGGENPSTPVRDGDEHTRHHTLMGAWTRLLATSDEAAQSKLGYFVKWDLLSSKLKNIRRARESIGRNCKRDSSFGSQECFSPQAALYLL